MAVFTGVRNRWINALVSLSILVVLSHSHSSLNIENSFMAAMLINETNFAEYLFRDIPILEIVFYLCAMTKEERVLRFKYPDRTEFTDAEILEVRRLLSKDGDKDESSLRLPTRFVPIGGRVAILGRLYRCVEADKNLLTDPCKGCDLSSENCSFRFPQCSPFDRRDHKRAWFKLIKV